MVKQGKIDAVESLAEKMQKAKSVVLTDYRGLTVEEVTELRRQLREENIEYKVVKNRLTKIALQKAGCDSLDEILSGPTAIAFGYEDPAPAARVIYEYSKSNDKLQPKGGLLEGKRIDLETLERLSKLPTKEEMLTRLLGSLTSPITKFALALNNAPTRVVYALKALQEQKES